MSEQTRQTAALLNDVRDIIKESVIRIVRPEIARASFQANRETFGVVKTTSHFEGADYVTPIDVANEMFLLDSLTQRLPGAFAVGEETFDKNPDENIARLQTGYSWVVDPLDGTNNVARKIRGDIGPGEPEPGYGVMAALLKDGQPVAAWIHYNNAEQDEGIVYGGFGHGVFVHDMKDPRNHRKLGFDLPLRPGVPGNLVMTTVEAYPKDAKYIIRENVANGSVAVFEPSPKSAAVETALFLQGHAAAKASRQFRIWDHAPGFALTREAGGHAAFMNGAPFSVARQRKEGVLLARSPEKWLDVRHGMLGYAMYDRTADPVAQPVRSYR